MKFKPKELQQPSLYEKGTAIMWTDEYISKQLLQVHLNTEIDLASRKLSTIENTCDWILDKLPAKKLKILDLGCGPGLYTELLARKGHEVTGVDFSKSSIEYARKRADENDLSINYLLANYLELELEENCFDLIVMIFTDMGVLLPVERERMMNFIFKLLKPGGTFIFDVLNDTELEMKLTPESRETTEKGFWKPNPYQALSESFLYKKEKVILYQHSITDAMGTTEVYRFWTHFFSHADLKRLVTSAGFNPCKCYNNVLPESNQWGGSNVTFCVAEKQ